ncbi:MAG TPA: hypothetical protein VJH68_01445 [Candidatus Nanoarchaeia archaeon]|nr:hypothetical protein [Candidatus Nanoarchaeia archaeon]
MNIIKLTPLASFNLIVLDIWAIIIIENKRAAILPKIWEDSFILI